MWLSIYLLSVFIKSLFAINLWTSIIFLGTEWEKYNYFLSKLFWGGGGFPGGTSVKNPLANSGDMSETGLIPKSGTFPDEGHDNPFQYTCLENPMDRGT